MFPPVSTKKSTDFEGRRGALFARHARNIARHPGIRRVCRLPAQAKWKRNIRLPISKQLPAWKERLQVKNGALSEVEARRLLADYGIRGPHEKVAGTAQEARQAAASIGYPVVLKILSADIQHKTEAGGVKVGLKDGDAVEAAYKDVMDAARRYKPNAKLDGVIIQEMIPSSSVEVILGLLRDPGFGPVVVFGSGGILVELVKDSALRLPPLSHSNALAMIEATRGVKLLRGFRGRPAADIAALANALVSLSSWRLIWVIKLLPWILIH